jgi:oxygen-dependent protoporphyrinogen oxidase
MARLSPGASVELARIRYASSATVFLGYRAGATGPLPASTGFLIPFTERRRIFGCTFVSNKFEGRAPDGCVLLRAFVGGAADEPAAALPDADMLAMVRQELSEMIGLTAEPVLAHIARWPRSNPQYETGHGARMREIDRHLAGVPGLQVTGSALRGVGIPDGVALGREAAEGALAYVSRP